METNDYDTWPGGPLGDLAHECLLIGWIAATATDELTSADPSAGRDLLVSVALQLAGDVTSLHGVVADADQAIQHAVVSRARHLAQALWTRSPSPALAEFLAQVAEAPDTLIPLDVELVDDEIVADGLVVARARFHARPPRLPARRAGAVAALAELAVVATVVRSRGLSRAALGRVIELLDEPPRTS